MKPPGAAPRRLAREAGWLLGVVERFERLEAATGQPHSSWADHSTDDPQRRSEIDRIELQPKAGHQVVAVGEDLGPMTLQAAPVGQGPGRCELFDECATVDADHPRGELDPLDMGEYPVEPSTYAFMPMEANSQQLDGAIVGETRHDPVQIASFECLVEP